MVDVHGAQNVCQLWGIFRYAYGKRTLNENSVDHESCAVCHFAETQKFWDLEWLLANARTEHENNTGGGGVSWSKFAKKKWYVLLSRGSYVCTGDRILKSFDWTVFGWPRLAITAGHEYLEEFEGCAREVSCGVLRRSTSKKFKQ